MMDNDGIGELHGYKWTCNTGQTTLPTVVK